MTLFQTIIIAIVEGITEFLPISSTGHMIITEAFLKIQDLNFAKIFTVNIQFGAILSVVVLYWKRFFPKDQTVQQLIQFYMKLFVAFIPAAIIGFLAGDFIDSLLENVSVVATTLLIGGIILIFVDKVFPSNDSEPQDVSYKTAFIIGCFQCIAMIPGVSRSAATIIGGLTQKLNRKTAAEFSFFLAVPTMFAASAYKLLKDYKYITADNIQTLAIGNLVSFIVALLAIKFFIGFLTKHGFKVFGYYRIVAGVVLLLLLYYYKDLHII